jgi:hypothetical protein
VTLMARPPPGSARASMSAPWAVAMARTMDRPRPRPWPWLPWVPRSPSRWDVVADGVVDQVSCQSFDEEGVTIEGRRPGATFDAQLKPAGLGLAYGQNLAGYGCEVPGSSSATWSMARSRVRGCAVRVRR